ncbi:MAG: Sec-independent protein translocase subunit TatA/TatB [Pirellulales bacterium]
MVDQLSMNIPVLSGFIFGGLGMQELVIVAVVAVLLFGKNLPTVARTFGRHYSEFKKGLGEISSEFKNATGDIQSTITDTTKYIEP